MLKKFRNYLGKRWEKVTYRKIETFYAVMYLLTAISFIIAVTDRTWHDWKILVIILVGICLVMFYLYYAFEEKIEEKRRAEIEKIYHK